MADYICDNECSRGFSGRVTGDTNFKGCGGKCMGKKEKGITYYEYVGPVKIVVVHPPPNIYNRTVSTIVLITTVYLLIGVVVMIALYTSLDFKNHWSTNVHIWLSTLGFQLCLPSALLMESSVNILSIHLTPKERLIESILLRTMTFLCVTTACAILGLWKIEWNKWNFESLTIHSCSGVLACGFSTFDVFSIVCNYRRNLKALKFFGLIAFTSSSLCYCSGIIKPLVLEFFKTKLVPFGVFMCLICGYCTIVVVFVIFIEWFSTSAIKKEGVKDASVGSSSQGSRIDN